jgi:hypothetical protein
MVQWLNPGAFKLLWAKKLHSLNLYLLVLRNFHKNVLLAPPWWPSSGAAYLGHMFATLRITNMSPGSASNTMAGSSA